MRQYPATQDRQRYSQRNYAAFTFCFFCIRGVGGFALPCSPLICGLPAGVGTDVGPPFMSSSALMPDARLRFVPAGEVVALGPFDVVPCWL